MTIVVSNETGGTALGRDAARRTARHVTGPYRFVELEGVSHWIAETEPRAHCTAPRRPRPRQPAPMITPNSITGPVPPWVRPRPARKALLAGGRDQSVQGGTEGAGALAGATPARRVAGIRCG